MYRGKRRFGGEPGVVVRSKTTFNDPLHWKAPKLIFACSWSDWFIQEADIWREEAWEIIRRTPQHTYQILTKRPHRIIDHLPEDWGTGWENVWLGVSIENKDFLFRKEILQGIPAFLRFISAEPLLGPIDFHDLTGIHWLITGGESGPKARPMKSEWAISIKKQCQDSGVIYFHKQNGGNIKKENVWGGKKLEGKVWSDIPIH